MNVHISYRVQKTPDIEKEITHIVGKLQKRLQFFRPELVHLKGLVEKNSPRKGITVALNLRLPSGQMAAQESAPVATAAIKGAFSELLQQVSKHKALLRNSHKWARHRREPGARPETRMPFEKTLAAVQTPAVSAEDIRSYVNASLGRLERFVERELFIREASEEISSDAVSREEVIDEVIVRALGDGEEKPERMRLEPWLYRLAIASIDDLAVRGEDGIGRVPLEESARKQNVRASDEAGLQFHQPDETLTEESIIPDRRVSTPEDIAYSDEMVELVQYALAGSGRVDREAFILHTIEGFSIEEIAAITDRKDDEIRTSITAARQHVRRFARLPESVRQRGFQRTGTT